jgi:2-aminoadipate transaminase
MKIDYEELMSRFAASLRPNAIRSLMPLLVRPDIVSFGGGAPSSETLPIEELAEMASRVIRDRGRSVLQYGPTRGQPALVQEVALYLRSRGMKDATASEIVLTTGSQQGLDLVSRVVGDPGDVALVELPSYVGGTIALHNSGARLVGVQQDQDGVVIPDLRERIDEARAEGRRPKCIYTIPNFQNPSGITLAAERRQELVRVAEEQHLLIIEDDPYAELYFDDEASRLPPLASLCPSHVIYLGTFSKVLAPGLRTAWLRAPKEIAAKIETAKEGADLSSSQLDQALVYEALRTGLVDSRLPMIREFYRTRCVAMTEALESHAPSGTTWTHPRGGFFVLMETDRKIDATKLLPQAIEAGVAYVPGQPFFVDSSGASTFRMAFSKESPQNIKTGIERLCRVIGQKSGATLSPE